MQTLARILLTILLAIAIAVPSVGGEGGENAGGTGVWILPRSSCLSGFLAPNVCSPNVGSTHSVADMAHDFTLRVDEECGEVVATAVDPATSASIVLAVSGRDVIVTPHLFDAVRGAGGAGLSIVISDAANRGYVITATLESSGAVTFSVR